MLRLRRLTADLEFRSRDGDGERDVGATLATVQLELARVRRRHRRPLLRAQRRAAAARSLTRPMRFAIHYLTEYRYDEPVSDNLNVLRVTPASTPTQELEDFRVQVDPEARLHRHADYFGTQVVEFGITRPHEHLTIDVRARVTTSEPPELLGGGWDALADLGYRSAGAEYLLPAPIAGRWDDTLERAARGGPRRDAGGDAARAVRADPRPLRVPRRRHLRRLDGRGPARGRRAASARTSRTSG